MTAEREEEGRAFDPPLALLLAGFAVAALVAIAVGRALRLDGPPSVFWPGTGLLLGLLVVTPTGRWPALAAVALAADLLAVVVDDAANRGQSLIVPLAFAVSNVGVPFGIAALLRVSGLGRPWSSRQIMAAAAIAALVCALGALVAILPGTGSAAPLLAVQLWWTADMLGVVAVTPVVVTLWLDSQEGWTVREASGLELGALVIVAALAMTLVFGNPPAAGLARSPFILVPVVFWAAARFPPVVVAIFDLLLALVASTFTRLGYGPFAAAGASPLVAVLPLQFFLTVLLTSTFALSVAIDGRRRALVRYVRAEGALLRAVYRLTEAEEQVRRRVAEELHDTAAQFAVGARFLLDKTLRAPLPVAVHADLREVSSALERVEHELDRTMHALAAPVLDRLGLQAALRDLVEDFRKRGDLDLALILDGPVDAVPAPLDALLYRWVRELLTNVARHARATVATVRVSVDGRTVTASVEDDGIGFDPAPVLAGSSSRVSVFGLGGILDRAYALGGRADVRASIGGGCRVEIRIPKPPGAR